MSIRCVGQRRCSPWHARVCLSKRRARPGCTAERRWLIWWRGSTAMDWRPSVLRGVADDDRPMQPVPARRSWPPPNAHPIDVPRARRRGRSAPYSGLYAEGVSRRSAPAPAPAPARGGSASIDYRHVIWSLVRKPGAFAHYRYRDDLFPSLTFRRAYDALNGHAPERADRHYVRLLHLAASTSESEIETALGLLLDQHVVPTFDVVRDLTRPPAEQRVPQLSQPRLDLSVYDRLLSQEAARA